LQTLFLDVSFEIYCGCFGVKIREFKRALLSLKYLLGVVVRRVVVTGLGMINSVGHDKDSSFDAIVKCNS